MSIASEDLLAVRGAAALDSVLPYIREALGKLENRALMRAFTKLNKGELTPNDAFATLMELYTMNSLLKTLETKIRVGVSTGEDIKDELNRGVKNAQG